MSSYRIARRAFLRGCGSSALMLPLLRSIEARAQAPGAPLRFLVIHRPLGTALDLWRPSSPASTASFTLPAASAPFAPLRSKMVMIDGLNIVPASLQAADSGGQNTAEGGMLAIMTGQPTLGRIGQQDHAAGGPSIDQILLDQSSLLGGRSSTSKTAFGSLQLAADIRCDRDEVAPRVMSYLPPRTNQPDINLARQPLYPEQQPIDTYNRLFAGVTPPARPSARKQSVLDFARRDLARMRKLVPSSQLPKLDTYEGAIAQLEAALRSAPVKGCAKPEPPERFALSGKQLAGSLAPPGGSRLSGVDYYDPADPDNHPYERLAQAQLALIRAAFQCDLVRVATFMWAAATGEVWFPATFQGATVRGGAAASQPIYAPHALSDPGSLAWYAQIDQYFSQQTAAFLQTLDSTTDVDGNTLLDNTVVVYLSDVGRNLDNDFRNVPFLVFGGKNTRIKGGQLLSVNDGPLASASGAAGNRPTNDVWLALAPLFGVNLPSLGAPAQFTGPLPNLLR